MTKNYQTIKKKIFREFSQALAKKKIDWIVIGGLNEYPNKVGRDLDIVLKQKNKKNIVLNIFEMILKKNNIKNIFKKKNQFYGSIIFAYDDDLNYYELHICHNKILYGFLSLDVNFKKNIKKLDHFYINTNAYIFKNLLQVNKKIKNVISKDDKKNLPVFINLFFFLKKKKLNKILIYILVSFFVLLSNPLNFISNFNMWIKKKYKISSYKHSKIYQISKKNIEKKTIFLVKKNFTDFYRGIICINKKDIFYKLIFLKLYKKNIFLFNFLLFLRNLIYLDFKNSFKFIYFNQNISNKEIIKINNIKQKYIINKILKGINV